LFQGFSETKLLGIASRSRAKAIDFLSKNAAAVGDEGRLILESNDIASRGFGSSEQARWFRDRTAVRHGFIAWSALMTIFLAAAMCGLWELLQSKGTTTTMVMAAILCLSLPIAAVTIIAVTSSIIHLLRLSFDGYSRASAEIFDDLGRRVCLIGDKNLYVLSHPRGEQRSSETCIAIGYCQLNIPVLVDINGHKSLEIADESGRHVLSVVL
jgi:hypothetical protein